MRARDASTNYYVNKQRANSLIKNKISWLKEHPKEQLNVFQIIMDLTEELPISEKHITNRLDLIVKLDPTIHFSEETIYYSED